MSELNIPQPSEKEVKEKIKDWNSDSGAKLESDLDTLFTKTYPLNNNVDEVLEKIVELNKSYKTFYTSKEKLRKVAEGIVKLDIDGKLKSGDIEIVNKMAYTDLGYHFSFASKYCSFHNPNVFALYDSCVAATLYNFLECSETSEFDEKKLELYTACLKRDYKNFLEVIYSFREKYKLEKFSLRELDHYLWSTGKDIQSLLKRK